MFGKSWWMRGVGCCRAVDVGWRRRACILLNGKRLWVNDNMELTNAMAGIHMWRLMCKEFPTKLQWFM